MIAQEAELFETAALRLKFVADILAGQSPESEAVIDFDGEGLPFMQGNSEFGSGNPIPTKRCDTAPRVAPAGSVLVSVRAPVGAVNAADRAYGIGRGLAAVRGHGINMGYCRYLLESQAEKLNSIATGSTFTAITGSDLGNIQIPISSPSTQRVIADFLDRETAQVDAFIAKSRHLVTLLAERRTAVLLRAALESGDRSRVPIRAVLAKLDRAVDPSAPVVTAFRDGVVTDRANRRMEGFTETVSEDHESYQGIEPGDLVFHGLDGFAGAVGISDSSGACSPVYHVCAVNPSLGDARYLSMILRALGLSGFLEAFAWSVRQRSVDYRNWSVFGKLPITLPSLDVQRALVLEVDAQHARIDDAIVTAERGIVLARERRAALISAAVTGQLEVAA